MKGKDILGMYSDNSLPKVKSKGNNMVRGGGMPVERDVMNHANPSTPGYDHHATGAPGLGGTNYGNSGFQGARVALLVDMAVLDSAVATREWESTAKVKL